MSRCYDGCSCALCVEFDTVQVLRSKLDAMAAENKRNYDKWWDYEQEYILPCFKWAKECGIDLPALVSEAKGNSTVRFFGALRDQIAELRAYKVAALEENLRFRAALEEIIRFPYSKDHSSRIAHEALRGKS